MSGFLNDLNLDQVESDPNAFPDGMYDAVVTKCKLQSSRTNKNFLVITYQVDGNGPHAGKTIDEWKLTGDKEDEAKDKNAKSWLKMRILSLGVPESRLATVEPEDIIGTEVVITTKTNGDFKNVNKVVLREGASVGGSSNSLSAADL